MQEVINKLEKELDAQIALHAEFEELECIYRHKAEETLAEVWKIRKALDALEGREESPQDEAPSREAVEAVEERPREVPARTNGPERPRIEVDTRLPCNGCGGRLEPATRTLSSGKVVRYLMCTDSGCNNEVYA